MQTIKSEYAESTKEWLERMITQSGEHMGTIAEKTGIPYKRLVRYKVGLRDMSNVDFHNLCLFFFKTGGSILQAPVSIEVTTNSFPPFGMGANDKVIVAPPITRKIEAKKEAELEPLTPFEAAKELGSVSVHTALEFFTVCQYMEAAGLTLCRKKRQEKPDGKE